MMKYSVVILHKLIQHEKEGQQNESLLKQNPSQSLQLKNLN
jgi:hypothetical protein